jgi:excinuclease UvrABC ATPase subunit
LAKLWRLQGDLGNDILKGSFGSDLGLEGGDKGSEIVMAGTPEEVAEHPTW